MKSNTEEFIKKAREIHGNKYDYSKVIYFNAKTKVIITCLIHGEFEQTPDGHLSGHNCPKCSNNRISQARKSNTIKFIKKAKEIHNNKYDYSEVNYVTNHDKVTIICPTHGDFLQSPNNHLNGGNCPKCYGRNKNTKEFIQQARKIHGILYDYSKTIYVDSKTKIIVVCPEHGEFKQTPHNHLHGQGCFKCGKENAGSLQRFTTENFIKKAKKVHGNKYNYSEVKYINSNTKINIICPLHGKFEQVPFNHLKGQNCPKCTGNIKLTTNEFVQKASKIYNNKYDYSQAKYINAKTKIIIICPEHGEFKQEAFSHLQGFGCSKCNGIGFKKKSLNEIKKLIQPLKFKTQQEYFQWWNNNKKYCQENGIPKNLPQYYKKSQ